MEIKVENLLKGDEVIILGQSPKYVKLLEDPKEKGPCKWRANKILQHTIRCHINVDIVEVTVSRWDYKSRTHKPMIVLQKTHILETPIEGGGIIKKIDLNDHRLWLVKREMY